MNYKELQNNFKIRYNKNSSPQCVFTGYPLFLLGDITYNCENYALLTSLSPGTALSFANSQNNAFSVQNTTDNCIYTCPSHTLSDYHEENYSKNIFNLISSQYCNLNTTGLNMLFSYDIDDVNFQTHSAPLLTALSYFMTEKQTPTQLIHSLQNLKYSHKEYAKILASLDSVKNSCILITENIQNYQHFPFPMSDKKIIIIKTDEKNEYISLYMSKAYSSYLNYKTKNNIPYSFEADISALPLSEKEIRLLSFLYNEKSRIKKYPEITTFDEFSNIISDSANELLNLTSSQNTKILADIILSTHIPLTFRPMPDESAFYCILHDNDVDHFINILENSYEKKAGYKPTFYICDTVTGGLNLGITR